jgi:hypothetical protein
MMLKIIAAAIALVAFRRITARARKGGTLTVELLFWTIVFSGVALAAFFPEWTDKLASWLGISSGFHALTFLAISALLLISFRLLGKVKELDRNVTLLVRARALEAAQRAPQSKDEPPGPERPAAKVDGETV